jgi:hypothetical protein
MISDPQQWLKGKSCLPQDFILGNIINDAAFLFATWYKPLRCFPRTVWVVALRQ